MVVPDKDMMVQMYERMISIRFFEEAVSKEYKQGKLPGLVHLYMGQEASAVGVCSALHKDDYITSTHRGHGHLIAKGANMKRMMAELYGKATGYNKGKGGSMHVADVDINIIGANGIVGAGIPIATGAALQAKMKRTGQISVSFFGDGAVNQGTFYESINLAAAWKLPAVFVCENNTYGEFTASREVTAGTVIGRAEAFGIPGSSVDGNDVLAVYAAAKEAVELARAGGGPSLIETVTYRQHGHTEREKALLGVDYRPPGEMDRWIALDPIPRFKTLLLETLDLEPDELTQIEQAVAARVEEALEFAYSSPYPSPEEALEDLFVHE